MVLRNIGEIEADKAGCLGRRAGRPGVRAPDEPAGGGVPGPHPERHAGLPRAAPPRPQRLRLHRARHCGAASPSFFFLFTRSQSPINQGFTITVLQCGATIEADWPQGSVVLLIQDVCLHFFADRMTTAGACTGAVDQFGVADAGPLRPAHTPNPVAATPAQHLPPPLPRPCDCTAPCKLCSCLLCLCSCHSRAQMHIANWARSLRGPCMCRWTCSASGWST